jgi:hypothetical protein
MTTQMFNPAEELKRAVDEGRLSEESLEAITEVPTARLRFFLAGPEAGVVGVTAKPQPLSSDEATRLAVLAAQIGQGLEIDDDERLRATLEGLTAQFHLTPENIALLIHAEPTDLAVALREPASLPADRKYALASRLSYLTNAIERARPGTVHPER